MKTLLLALLLPLTSLAHKGIPDLPPDALSADYRPFLRKSLGADTEGLDPIFAAGERNSAWLTHINSFRPENDKLSFTSKETQRGYPIDQPNEYNPTIIKNRFAELKAKLPPEIFSVIFENADFTKEPPIETKAYLELGLQLDRSYQSAARWRTMKPWLPMLEGRRADDIRGYYFLSRLENREERLKNFASQGDGMKAQIKEWLIGMCLNRHDTVARCEQEFTSNLANLPALYRSLETRSKAVYDENFTIPDYAARSDFRWESSGKGERLVAPFTDPETPAVRHFMQFNVEDEWKWANWELKLPFTTEGGHPYVVFRPGATPNVNGLGGDRITMDANQPLTEYDAQWTIRHEFGHVLGLPDCYVEFYVPERKAIINYQIDVENIMCSRRGHVKAENVAELKRVYGR